MRRCLAKLFGRNTSAGLGPGSGSVGATDQRGDDEGRSCLQVVGQRRGQVWTQRIHRGDAGCPEEAEVRRKEELQRLFGESYSGKLKIGNITAHDKRKEETLSRTRPPHSICSHISVDEGTEGNPDGCYWFPLLPGEESCGTVPWNGSL